MGINEAAYEAYMAFLFDILFPAILDMTVYKVFFQFRGGSYFHFQREITRYRNLDFPLLSENVYTHNNLSRNRRRSARFCPIETLGL